MLKRCAGENEFERSIPSHSAHLRHCEWRRKILRKRKSLKLTGHLMEMNSTKRLRLDAIAQPQRMLPCHFAIFSKRYGISYPFCSLCSRWFIYKGECEEFHFASNRLRLRRLGLHKWMLSGLVACVTRQAAMTNVKCSVIGFCESMSNDVQQNHVRCCRFIFFKLSRKSNFCWKPFSYLELFLGLNLYP